MSSTTTAAAAVSSGAGAAPSSNARKGLASSLLALGLVLIFLLGVLSRLFLTFRYEWYEVNEFDPQFQARVTKIMAEEGWHAFFNFFDLRSWYPLGRATGPTLYPGLMITSSLIYWGLQAINVPITITLVMHFLPPLFTGFTALACFGLAREAMLPSSTALASLTSAQQQKIYQRADGVGLLAAYFMSIVPGYAQRSVAGAYDNEAIAIFALVFTFYCWCKAVNSGSLRWGVATAMAYFYMVSAWGGYIFIINLIPIHVLLLLVSGRYSTRLYVAYSSFYAIGTLLSMQISFVGFQPVYSAEHLGAMGVFGLLQLAMLNSWLKGFFVDHRDYVRARSSIVSSFLGLAGLAFVVGTVTGYIAPFTGRLWSLLDPTFAKNNIPIIASVAEHQPTSWSSYFFDFHVLAGLMPAGFYFLLKGTGTSGAAVDDDEDAVLADREEDAHRGKSGWFLGIGDKGVFAPNATDSGLFLVVYGAVGLYFSGVMIRLILTVAPAACLLGAVAVHAFLYRHVPISFAFIKASLGLGAAATSGSVSTTAAPAASPAAGAGGKPAAGVRAAAAAAAATAASPFAATAQRGLLSCLATALVLGLLFFFNKHSIWTISEAYSSPSIVMIARQNDGRKIVFDDYREAYYWLRQNTPEDAKIASWWDYGYQMSSMANRTVIVDNNTWNNTHIATVGRAMATPEEEAWPILKSLDADYVLIIFGGFSGYSGDDINKFYWMERIGGGVFPNEVPKERDFVGRDGSLRVDKEAGPAMLNCLMYKLSYHRFGEVSMGWNYPKGLDRARNQEIAIKNVTLTYFDEAFTSEHWIVRIYKVKKDVGNKPLDIASLPKPKAAKKVDKAAEKEDWRVSAKAETRALESASGSSEAGSSSGGASGGKGRKKASK